MFLTGAMIAGGVLITGGKVLHEEKRKKDTPWTVYAENMAKKQSGKLTYGREMSFRLKRRHYRTQIAEYISKVFKEESKWRSFSLFSSKSGIRDQQLKEINRHRTDLDEVSEAEKKANRELMYSSVALMLTTGGALFYAPLNLLSVPIILMTLKQYVVRAYRGVFHEKKVGVAVIDLLGNAGPLLTGHFFVAALAVHLSNLSRKLLIKTEDHSHNSLTNVFGQQPRFVWVQQGEGQVEVQIPFDTLRVDDIVVVQAGQSIPIDGTITSGIGQIDQRALTGESQPVEKAVGESVFASTLLLSGRIGIQVEKTGASTVAAQIGDILNSTADFKSQVQSRGNKIVDQGALPTVLLSMLALPLFGPESALAMFFAAFGYHMRHAAPIAVLNYLGMASQNGVLIKDGRSLELLSEVDTFVFDKTGTLTEEVPTVGQIYCSNGYVERDLLTYAAAAEHKQTHPIAQAILNEARRQELPLLTINEAEVKLGYGLKVMVQARLDEKSKLIRVGSRRFMEMEGIAMVPDYQEIQETCYEEGHSLVYVAIGNQLGGAIELRPTIRSEAKEIIHQLKKRNMSMVIISGDHEKPTKKLAQELGIERYFAEVLPQDKASLVKQLQQGPKGRNGETPVQQSQKSVCFIGDGINDSIALKTANVSISLRGASTAATDSASIILMDATLNQLIPLLDMANSLDANLKRGTILTILPGLICVGGVFFFHFSLLSGVLLYYGGLAASISNAMLPLLQAKTKDKE